MNINVPVVSARKDVALEGLRGLASITVLIWHIILGFYPELLGDYGGAVSGSGIRGHFWFGLVYGSAAVALFFVLSGYVLTLKFFDRAVISSYFGPSALGDQALAVCSLYSGDPCNRSNRLMSCSE